MWIAGVAVGYEPTEEYDIRFIYQSGRWFAAIDETPHLCLCPLLAARQDRVQFEEGFDMTETCCLCLECFSL